MYIIRRSFSFILIYIRKERYMFNYAIVILTNIYTFILSLFAAYYVCKWLILNNSWKKLFFIEPYIYMQTIVIYFQFQINNDMRFNESVVFLIGIALACIRAYLIIIKYEKGLTKIMGFIGIILVLILFCIQFSKKFYFIAFGVKVLLFFTLLYCISLIKPQKIKYYYFILLFILYVICIMIITLISYSILQTTIGYENFHIAVRNLYSISEVQLNIYENIDNIFNFILIKFIDAIILGKALEFFVHNDTGN